ncbi:hypothetical protein [Streptosporangium sp. NPDC006007]
MSGDKMVEIRRETPPGAERTPCPRRLLGFGAVTRMSRPAAGEAHRR